VNIKVNESSEAKLVVALNDDEARKKLRQECRVAAFHWGTEVRFATTDGQAHVFTISSSRDESSQSAYYGAARPDKEGDQQARAAMLVFEDGKEVTLEYD